METSPETEVPFNRDDYSELYESIELLKKGDPSQSVQSIARLALDHCLGLIGTLESQPIHDFATTYISYDRNFGVWECQVDDQPFVQFTIYPSLAIMCAMFGDLNIRGQREILNDEPIGEKPGYGWEEFADGGCRVIARADLVRRARKAGANVMGFIDLVYISPGLHLVRKESTYKSDEAPGREIDALIASYIPLHTVTSIPVRGMDLPKDLKVVSFDKGLTEEQ